MKQSCVARQCLYVSVCNNPKMPINIHPSPNVTVSERYNVVSFLQYLFLSTVWLLLLMTRGGGVGGNDIDICVHNVQRTQPFRILWL